MSMDSGKSVILSFPSQTSSSLNSTSGQRSRIPTAIRKSWSTLTTSVKKAWLAVTFPLREIWSPLACHVGGIVGVRTIEDFRELFQDLMPCLRGVVLHLILCLTLTILLPISLLWNLILKGRFTLTWERVLAISCIAMSVDPLFFYIPVVDENSKCLGMDRTLSNTVLVLRSLTDLTFTLHIIALIHDRIDIPSNSDSDSDPEKHIYERILRRMKWLSKDIIIDVIAILPIPQVTIIIVLFRMRASGYLYEIVIGNICLPLQFFARGYQIYHFHKQFQMLGKWAKSVFYFLMYIMAGHVLGAYWYFLSIQREISCWHQACRNTKGCRATNYCEDTSSSADITLLNDFCPINPSNATLFDFGIFLDALQSGNTGSISFTTKFFYTFWWGIRNLSNFGSDLETSNYVWENCFTIFISLVGLLLFLYLMGNVQTYILWESTKALEVQEEKVKAKYEDLHSWMLDNAIPEKIKIEVVKIIKYQKIFERNYATGVDVDVDLVFVFNAITVNGNQPVASYLKEHFCANALMKVSILQDVGEDEFNLVLKFSIPVIYEENSYVVRAGEPDDKMLIITQGVLIVYVDNTAAGSSSIIIPKSRFEKGEVYGEELLNGRIPISTRDVKCQTKVEAFALTSRGLKFVVTMLRQTRTTSTLFYDPELVNKAYRELTTTRSEKLLQKKMKMDCKEKDILDWLSRNGVHRDQQTSVMKHIKANSVLEENLDAEVDVRYLFSIRLPWHIEYEIKKDLCMRTLHKVPVLDGVDEDVLYRICMSLDPVVLPKNNCVVKPGGQIDRMLIIVEGEITLTEQTFHVLSRLRKRGNIERILKKGDFFGEELLTWAFPDVSISKYKPDISRKYVDCCAKVEAFALTKEGVESVVAYYREGTNIFEELENGKDGVADTNGTSTSPTIEQRLDQLIQLQVDMLQQHRDEMANQGRRLDQIAAFLARLGYPDTPPPAA
ncbi:cyclic nucleotide-gated ion channel 1-like [Rosa rugosa]|uniref:cyclic nucleotide-gated ion channel 1-like n=1 Tax=Rosa rugosa TaxID=74645 RepID=UPI002B4183EB|nr:cyclic nucleotide-gated ion channel 1-like [Rosa rugosa]XP_062012690.1 cyclic nucleotide-gated ion channel 1-like [Rosa rugosa]